MAILIGLWHKLILWVLSQSFPPKRGGKCQTTGLGSISQCRRDLCQGLCQGPSGASLPKRPHLESGNDACSHWQEVCWWHCFHQFY